jgi:hypothetical protein
MADGFDTGGVFHRKWNWVKEMLNGQTVKAQPMDEEFDNIASALNECFLKNGKSKLEVDLNMDGHSVINTKESFDTNNGAIATVKQVVADPTRIFIDLGEDGQMLRLKGKDKSADIIPKDDYAYGYYFFIAVKTTIMNRKAQIRFENTGYTSDWDLVDNDGQEIPQGNIKGGCVYLVCARSGKFYFLNVFTDFEGGKYLFAAMSNVFICDRSGSGYVEEFKSSFAEITVENTGIPEVEDVRSTTFLVAWGSRFVDAVKSLTSPEGSIKIDATNALYPRIDTNIKYLSPQQTINISSPNSSTVYLDIAENKRLNISSPLKSIDVQYGGIEDPNHVELESAVDYFSPDGTVSITGGTTTTGAPRILLKNNSFLTNEEDDDSVSIDYTNPKAPTISAAPYILHSSDGSVQIDQETNFYLPDLKVKAAFGYEHDCYGMEGVQIVGAQFLSMFEMDLAYELPTPSFFQITLSCVGGYSGHSRICSRTGIVCFGVKAGSNELLANYSCDFSLFLPHSNYPNSVNVVRTAQAIGTPASYTDLQVEGIKYIGWRLTAAELGSTNVLQACCMIEPKNPSARAAVDDGKIRYTTRIRNTTLIADPVYYLSAPYDPYGELNAYPVPSDPNKSKKTKKEGK